MFSSRFMLFPTFKKKIGVEKIFGGGGVDFFRVLCYFQHKQNFEILKSSPSLTG